MWEGIQEALCLVASLRKVCEPQVMSATAILCPLSREHETRLSRNTLHAHHVVAPRQR